MEALKIKTITDGVFSISVLLLVKGIVFTKGFKHSKIIIKNYLKYMVDLTNIIWSAYIKTYLFTVMGPLIFLYIAMHIYFLWVAPIVRLRWRYVDVTNKSILTLYTSSSSQKISNTLYRSSSMAITIIGVAVAQIDVKPTMSLNNIVTSSWLFASIFSPKTKYLYLKY